MHDPVFQINEENHRFIIFIDLFIFHFFRSFVLHCTSYYSSLSLSLSLSLGPLALRIFFGSPFLPLLVRCAQISWHWVVVKSRAPRGSSLDVFVPVCLPHPRCPPGQISPGFFFTRQSSLQTAAQAGTIMSAEKEAARLPPLIWWRWRWRSCPRGWREEIRDGWKAGVGSPWCLPRCRQFCLPLTCCLRLEINSAYEKLWLGYLNDELLGPWSGACTHCLAVDATQHTRNRLRLQRWRQTVIIRELTQCFSVGSS